ncbi:MAG: hypothetical protein CSB47_00500 [Proteobacteria bacterium]|nr:MAG: hypothetical protein CSB47_00500 [Pseudomonadota bacterium]
MKKSAIQFAWYMHLHPEAGLQQWHLMRTLPHGMSDLLQAAASGQKRSEVADSLDIAEAELKKAFIKFLQLVISDYQKSPYRGLAAREQASLDTCTRHKKLLQNVFHPDKFQNDKAHELIQQIQQSYDEVLQLVAEKKQAGSSAQSDGFHDHDSETDLVMDFQIKNAPRPSCAHRRREQKKQTNYVLMAGVAGLALASLLVVLIVPSSPQEVVRQPVISETPSTTPNKKIILAGSVDTATSGALIPHSQYENIHSLDNTKVQVLLNEFERGLEADLVSDLMKSKNQTQSYGQIMDLFATADHKKVFLHGFSWKPMQRGFYGEGEFLARFQFMDKNQWVTRKGKCSITLSSNDSKLLIEQFHFEDNLH